MGGTGQAASPLSPFLAVVNLSRRFGSTLAVKDFNLTVDEGEYITLLGPSGCGKTTTLRMIAGFVTPSTGQIRLDGQDIVGLPPERRPVNTVFQDYALFPHLTVWQNVEYGLRVRRTPAAERRQRVDEMLERVQLTALASRYPRYLSGGQQQRVALARALICRPRLLLLDEPLGALDARLREQMQGVLKDLQRDLNITFIHVTHDQSEALALSDRIAIMRHGVIEQVSSPHQLYQQPVNSFVADFLGTTNLFQGRCLDRQNERVLVEAAGQQFWGHSDLTFTPGETVFASVRPTAVRLGQPDDDTVNQFQGVVAEVTYRGEYWLAQLQVGQLEVLAQVVEGAGQTAPTVGQTVNLSWPVEACKLMKE